MSNLTITVDAQTLRKARIRALEQGTSVNTVLRAFLESYTGVHQEQKQAVRGLLELSRVTDSRSGGNSWTRDALHERGH